MSKPFKFRHVNQIVGLFVLGIAGAVVAVVFLAGREQGWFLPNYDLITELPEGGTEGLQEGAEITILGTRVGSVHRIAPQEDGDMMAVLRIRGDYFDQYVRSDSSALLKKKFGFGGDTFVEIKPGKGAPMPHEGGSIASAKDSEMTDLILEQVDEVKTEVLATLRQVQATLKEFAGLAADIRSPEGPLAGTLGHLERITGELAEGEGAMGAVLRDPAMAAEIRAVVESVRTLLADLEQSAARFPGLVDHADRSLALLPDIVRGVGDSVGRVPGLLDKVDGETDDIFLLLRQARLTLAESQKTLEGLQRHWLLSGAMDKAGAAKPAGGPLTPEELRALEERP